MSSYLSHNSCSFAGALASLRGLLDTIEESAQLGLASPEKASIEKDQIIESLYAVSEEAETMVSLIERRGIPFSRCGFSLCCCCRGAQEVKP